MKTNKTLDQILKENGVDTNNNFVAVYVVVSMNKGMTEDICGIYFSIAKAKEKLKELKALYNNKNYEFKQYGSSHNTVEIYFDGVYEIGYTIRKQFLDKPYL